MSTRQANAQHPQWRELSVEWSAPPECPDESSLIARVKRSVTGESPPNPLEARVMVTKHQAAYRAYVQIRTSESSGDRTLEHNSCSILTDSVALVIALSATESAPRKSVSDAGMKLAVSPHAAAVSGTLPRLALGAGAAVALDGWWALRAELSGTIHLSQDALYPGGRAIGATFSLLQLTGRICRIWTVRVLELGPCLGAQVSRIAAAGFGGAQQAFGAGYLIGPVVGGFLRVQLWAAVGLRVTFEGAFPVERQRFVYTDLGPLHRSSAVAAQLFVAPEVRF